MSEDKISFEEYIPTDKWSLQDWFLNHLGRVGVTLQALQVGYYRGGVDYRALTELFGQVSAYFMQIESLFKKFLTPNQLKEFDTLLAIDPKELELKHAHALVKLVSVFNEKSGLFKIVESRPMGNFAYARQKLGLVDKKEKK